MGVIVQLKLLMEKMNKGANSFSRYLFKDGENQDHHNGKNHYLRNIFENYIIARAFYI